MSAQQDAAERILAGTLEFRDWFLGLPDVLLQEVAPDVAYVVAKGIVGNVTLIRTPDGIVMSDTGIASAAPRILEELRKWSDRPVHTVVYTHGHWDHVAGLPVYDAEAKQGGRPLPRVIAHANVPKRLARYALTAGYNTRINQRQFPGTPLTWPPVTRAPDVTYGSMNFAGQVPAPTLRVTEGDTVRFTLRNLGALNHSIDFHAAQNAWSRVYQEVEPGASFSFDWTARYPGVFMYHCGAGPVIMHIGDGMYGMVIVDPKDGRPAAREYVIVQSEFYGSGGQVAKMLNDPPDYVVFNGQANRYKANPLPAKAGELVRLYIVNAGPNSSSAFHVIGALFSRYEASGYPPNAQGMHQTIDVPPGDGAIVELTFAESGTYPFVTHRFADASKGATGLFKVS